MAAATSSRSFFAGWPDCAAILGGMRAALNFRMPAPFWTCSAVGRRWSLILANVNRELRARGVGWSIIGASKEAGTICRICGLQQR